MAYPVSTPVPPLGVEEYLRLEEASTTRHEYVGGELFGLAGASGQHNRIRLNIAAQLWAAARGGPCRVYTSDMKLRVAADVFYYPDIQVVCDPEDAEDGYTSRPCLVVEVLSPSTEAIDKREKLLAYRRLPSLKAYVMVYRDEQRVARYWRDEGGAWWPAEVQGAGRVPFPCPELELSLAEIYEGLPPIADG